MESSTHRVQKIGHYLAIYAALMALLILTVIAAQFDLGRGNVIIALVIACIKALLVILFFMHVRGSSRLTWMFAAAGFVWLAIMVSLTMTDYSSRTPESNWVLRNNATGYVHNGPVVTESDLIDHR